MHCVRSRAQMTAERLAAELASHDTLQYIQVLEREQEKLHSQVKDISQQLHSAKVREICA